MDEIIFSAPEYQADQSLQTVRYRYRGSVDTGWNIEREGHHWLKLGPGYVPLQTLFCGICSTDLARHHLPFPLPQITGHELIAEYRGEAVAVEINASHAARGMVNHDCEYCRDGLDIHCPDRMTLGIDRLPGGFSPWVLAPIYAIHSLPRTVTPQAGALIEPFAAAVKAVEVSPPSTGDHVAVLGPRRLGMLIIAALDSHRKLHGKQFEITAVMRHPELKATAQQLGADKVIVTQPGEHTDTDKKFDIVFDTTGTPSGFEVAMGMSRQTVHLKSTHGRSVMGFDNMTAMVINEQVLTAFNEDKFCRLTAGQSARSLSRAIYISASLLQQDCVSHLDETWERLSPVDADLFGDADLKQFDIALVSSIDELHKVTRPYSIQGQSLLKAGGTVLFAMDEQLQDKSRLLKEISQRNLQIVTSRCGSFARTIEMLRQLPELSAKLQKHLVTQTMELTQLAAAMQLAGQSEKSIKVIVKTN